MKAKITKRTIENIPAEDRDLLVWDTEISGFGVKITPAGRRVYIVQYRAASRGPTRRYTIGRHGSPWTPDTARQETRRILGEVASGHDPAREKTERRNALTVAGLCDLYLAEGCATNKASTVKIYRGMIEGHIKPLLGTVVAQALTKADVERFLQAVAAGKSAADRRTGFRGRSITRGGQGIASRCVTLLGVVFSFAVARQIRDDNPAHGVKVFKTRKLDRFLSVEEMTRLGAALDQAAATDDNPFALAAIRLLALTGCRKGEILGLRWEEVDTELGMLRLADSKTGAKVVQLGAPALRLLEALPRIEGNPYVFPGSAPGAPFVGLQKFWVRVRDKAALDGVRMHDLRHSFASVGARRGNSLLLLGKLLGHARTSTTERYAHLADDPLKAAAEGIAETIDAALAGDTAKVIRLRKRPA